MTISSNTTLPTGTCFRNITINNNRILTLSDFAHPYYIKSINFQGAQGNLAFGTIPTAEKVQIYVEQPENNYTLNGNRLINTVNAPHQVEIIYTGTSTLTLNGTSQISANIIAPFATVNVLGNFNFYGGIQALTLSVTGNARLFYDEALGGPPVVSDLHYALKKTGQRYR